MNEKQKDIVAVVLWLLSVSFVITGLLALYTTFGSAAPYHKKIFPGLSTEPIESLAESGQLSESAMVSYHYAEKLMELLDFGIPVFAILVFHHLLMHLKMLIEEMGVKF